MPAPTYDLLKEFTKNPDDVDSISTAPFWIIAVFPFTNRNTFSKANLQDKDGVTADDAVRTNDPIIITGDCRSLNIENAKGSHVKSLTAHLDHGHVNYQIYIKSGDWCMAWILNYEDEAQRVIQKIQRKEAANGWNDGLKFVGRVDAVQRVIQRSQGDGKLTSAFDLRAFNLQELDNSIFYDQNLAEFAKEQNLTWLAKIGLDLRELFKQDDQKQLKDNVSLIIPSLVNIFLGKGINDETINPGSSQGLDAAIGAKAAPYAYLVPKDIGTLLNIPDSGTQFYSYQQILSINNGIQRFSNVGADSDPWKLFLMDHKEGTPNNYLEAESLCLGGFNPLMPEIMNTPLWSTLQQFLNPVINEMYTCMRANKDGNVVPTLVLRQIPFTTKNYADNHGSIVNTPFLSLPRWKLSSFMVNAARFGESNTTHINFVHVYGQNNYQAPGNQVSISAQMAQNKPVSNSIDIQRSGLRPYIQTVPCSVQNEAGKTPRDWMGLIADRLINSQYTINGTFSLKGISSPICEGDNVEFDDTVFHIESVSHNCTITEAGLRTFNTSLTVTNGTLTEERIDELVQKYPNYDRDLIIYPAMSDHDIKSAPGITVDTVDNLNTNLQPPIVDSVDKIVDYRDSEDGQ